MRTKQVFSYTRVLGCAALYHRYKYCDERLKPGPTWDILLWLSFLGFLIIGLYLTDAKLPG